MISLDRTAANSVFSAMTSGKTIQVLEKYRPFSFIFNVYNSDNFHNPKKKLHVFWKFLRAVGFSVVLTSLSLIMVSSYRFCVDKSFDVTEISLAIPILFCAFQQVLTYFSLMVNNRVIRQTVDHLQVVIEDREYLKKKLFLSQWISSNDSFEFFIQVAKFLLNHGQIIWHWRRSTHWSHQLSSKQPWLSLLSFFFWMHCCRYLMQYSNDRNRNIGFQCLVFSKFVATAYRLRAEQKTFFVRDNSGPVFGQTRFGTNFST